MTERLFSFAHWEPKTIKSFRRYLARYYSIPSYKKVLYTMIRFENMYKPIKRGCRSVDVYGTLTMANEYRKLMRYQVYMNKREIINTYDEKSGRRLVVTSTGHRIYYDEYPLARLRERKWDGYWTIVMYDIPVELNYSREVLRDKLKGLGFGSPQRSVYITPLSIQEDIEKSLKGDPLLRGCVWVLRAMGVMGMGNKEVVRNSWPVEELNKLYASLLEILPKIKKSKNKNALIQEWRQLFLALNSGDPYLPGELLPKEWRGDICEEEFIKLGGKGVLPAIFEKIFSYH